jgi:hypothetical protein
MDFELPEELRLLKENVRRFVDKELIPLEREVVNDGAARSRRSASGATTFRRSSAGSGSACWPR